MKSLVLCSKGSPAPIKALTKDLARILSLIPEYDYDEDTIKELKEVVEINECQGCVFLESTKRASFLWFATLDGVSIKARISDIKLVKYFLGNGYSDCGAELIFTNDFEENELSIFKNVIVKLFKNDKPKDRVISFFYYDYKVLMRIYSLRNEGLIEIGPRIDFSIEKILEETFKGKVIYTRKKEENII